MPQLKAIIFDVDGTLSETERDGHRVAFNLAFADSGLDWHWDEELYGQLLTVTGGKERLRYFLDSFYTGSIDEDIDQLVINLHAKKTAHYIALLAQNAIGLRPGVERLFDEIRQAGIRLAIATTTTPANVTALISSTLGEEALSWFDCIAAGDIVPAKKPAPDIFDYCLAELNLSADECLVFEDSKNGVISSCGAHIPTIVTLNDYTKDDDFSGAISVFDQLGEPNSANQCLAGYAVEQSYITVDSLRELHALAT